MTNRCNWIAITHIVTQDMSRDTRPNLKRVKCAAAARCDKCGLLRFRVFNDSGTTYQYANGSASTSYNVDAPSCQG